MHYDHRSPWLLPGFVGILAAGLAGCSSSSSGGSGNGPAPTVTGMKIVAGSGAALEANAGDAVPLEVVQTMSDGTTEPLPAGTRVEWTAPATIVTQDPDDAGPNSVLPEPGADPTAVYVSNPYRPDRKDYTGLLFVLDPGAASGGSVTVTASVTGAGDVSATVFVSPTPAGDAARGKTLYQTLLGCSGCHGATGDGSPPTAEHNYKLLGTAYPYPAPGLNDAPDSGNLGDDPTWNAALLGAGSQGDFDNNGVALRVPMPDWLGQKNAANQPLGAQDFADIYAFLTSQTQ